MGAGQSTVPMAEIDFESYRGLRYSKEVPGSRNAHQGPIYVTGQLPGIVDAEQTVYHAFMRGWSQENGTRPCYGTRRMENGVAGAYEWVTYGEVKTRVDAIASGLTTACGLKRQDVVAIFSKNRMEWCLASHATDRMAYTLVPLYDTLGPDAVPYIVNHTEARVLFAGADQFGVILECKAACPTLQFVIQFEDVTDEQRELARAKNVELMSLREIEALGRSRPLAADPPLPDDVSTICYTSGTTGNPKGVVLTQRNVAVVALLTEERLSVTKTDVHISYLPLPHVFERAVLTAMVRNGGAVGFYQGDVLYLMDDMATLAPTLFVSVPRLFNRVYDKITQGVAAAGGLKKLLFDQGFASKKAALATGGYKTHAFWDALVFAKVRMLLGGRVRLILSGSAPLAAEVKDFLKIVMSCDVVEGYGLSETAAALTVASPEMPLGPHVGPPIRNVEVRLEDVPEMGYTSRDKPRPRGEVLMRGPNLFMGYYKEPEKTAEVLDADGWFHTGDIGCWNADGTLSIVDRKKNIFKLSQGEYVAAEKIEGVYLKSKFVAQIFVYGDSLQSHLVGIVVPDPEVAEAWAQSHGGGQPATVAALAHNAAFQQAVLEDMDRTAKAAQLRGFEFVKHVHFHPEPFSMDAGLITPTFKLKRPQLKEFFQQQIHDLYAKAKKAQA